MSEETKVDGYWLNFFAEAEEDDALPGAMRGFGSEYDCTSVLDPPADTPELAHLRNQVGGRVADNALAEVAWAWMDCLRAAALIEDPAYRAEALIFSFHERISEVLIACNPATGLPRSAGAGAHAAGTD